jgi:formylglycine-generating enzyme required for sulfatase activity
MQSESNGRGRAISSSSTSERSPGRGARRIRGLVGAGGGLALALSVSSGGCTTFDGLTPTASNSTGSSGGGTSTSSSMGGAGGVGGEGVGGAGGTNNGGAGGFGGGDGGGAGAGIDCTNPQGPVMVAVKTKASPVAFCIDSTEVARDQYALFLATSPELNQAPPCNANMSFIPTTDWPPKPSEKNLPTVGVDFCDAAAYCAWAGKRLCGAIGGGGTDLTGADDPASSQWMNACSAGGTLKYPYGDAYQASTCNGLDYAASGVIKVGAAAMCVGGVPGLFDMSGNVREWEDACDVNDCRVRGGSYDSHGAADGELPCSGTMMLDRYDTDDFTGFRCCRD